jgi:hypothetical protein
MSEPTPARGERAWHFYLSDMIGFAEKVLRGHGPVHFHGKRHVL